MSIRRIRAVGGLATDPAHTMDPEALRVASNVLLHRPGLIQPRFGLGDTTGIASRTTDRRPIAIVPFDGDLVIQALDGSTYSLERGSVATVYSSDVAPPSVLTSGVSDFAEMRGALYFTTDDGVKKLADIAATAVSMAGVRTDYVPIGGALSTTITSASATVERYAIKDDGAAAYRYCWVSEDANGYVRRSAPSSRWVIAASQASGGPYVVRFGRLYLPSGIVAGDRLEIYRTEGVTPRTSTPGTEYYLAIEYVVTAANVSAGYISASTLLDETPDSVLGTALYTNPSQGGIQAANELPPLANHIALWADVAWYANTTTRRALPIEIVSVFDGYETADPDGAHARTGLHSRSLTGSFSFGSASVTAVASSGSRIHGMKAGQYVYDASTGPTQTGSHVDALTKIASISTTVSGFEVTTPLLAPGDTVTLSGATVASITLTWTSGAPGTDQVQIAGTAEGCAVNLAAEIDGRAFEDGAVLAASASGTTVTITAKATAGGAQGGYAVSAVASGTGQDVAYQLAMTKPALATSAGAGFTVCDYVTINGVEFYPADQGAEIAGSGASDPAYRLFTADTSSDASADDFNLRLARTADGLAVAVNAYTLEVDPTFGLSVYKDTEDRRGHNASDAAVLLMRTSAALAEFSFQCTIRPEAFRPRASETLTTEDTRARSRLHWSKPQEPEAVPLLNFVDVGRRDRDILALVPTERALLVFKEDGIYAVTGSAPSSWLVDEVDTSLRLVAPQATCVLNGVCYAWTNRGVMAVTEAGAQLVSAPISDQLREMQRLLPLDNANTKRAFWMLAHERLGLVILGVGDAASDTETAEWLVYHTSTARWAIWPIESRCAAYDAAEDRMVHAPAIDAWSVLYEREDEDAATSYRDASLSGLSASIAGTSVTIAVADFGGFVPSEGDVLLRTFEGAGGAITVARVVTGVEVSGSDYVITVESAGLAGTGSATAWHQGYAAAVEWHAQHIPGRGARWSEGHAHFGGVATAYISPIPMLIGGYSERDTSASTVTASITAADAASQQPKIVRVGLPRAVVRATHLYPRIEVNTAGALWRLAEIDLHAFAQSQRVAR